MSPNEKGTEFFLPHLLLKASPWSERGNLLVLFTELRQDPVNRCFPRSSGPVKLLRSALFSGLNGAFP